MGIPELKPNIPKPQYSECNIGQILVIITLKKRTTQKPIVIPDQHAAYVYHTSRGCDYEISRTQIFDCSLFLHSYLFEIIFMYQPLRFIDPTMPHHVCHMHKSLYYFKQTLWAWFQRFTTRVVKCRFQHSKIDSSLVLF